ncbi:MAG: protein-methionine-sulfoxide reductase catalytic subunit MsrP, partial [Thiohalospira sp.]
MKRYRHPLPPGSSITPESVYRDRRRFLRQSSGLLLGAALGGGLAGYGIPARADWLEESLEAAGTGPHTTDEALTDHDAVTGYNNFYEFGTRKRDPADWAHQLDTDPWSVTIDGEVEKPGTFAFEDIVRPQTLEERIYRLRCVEAWSMVIPWNGFELGALLKRHGPTSRAKYVVFETLHDPEQMRGQRRDILDWPYREALRMDEAMHPLTLLAVGLYGRELPNQNGAPLRL